MLTPLWQALQGAARRRPVLLVPWIGVTGLGMWLAPLPCAIGLMLVHGVRSLGGTQAGVAAGGALLCPLLPMLAGGKAVAAMAVALALGMAVALALPQEEPAAADPVVVPRMPRRRLAMMTLLPVLAALIAGLAWCRMPLGDLLLIAAAVGLAIHASGDALRAAMAVLLPALVAALMLAYGATGSAALASAVLAPAVAAALLASGGVAFAAWRPGVRGWRAVAAGAVVLAALVWLGLALAPRTLVVAMAPALSWITWLLSPASVGGWPTLSPGWRWFTLGKLRGDPLYRLLRDDPRPWGRVLDIGCGHGLGALVAARRGDTTRWEGLDLDPRKLAVAAQLLSSVPAPAGGWHLRVAHPPEAVADAADTVLALDILHYWDEPAQLDLLRWLAARLAPGGGMWLREGVLDDPASATVVAGERFTTAIGLNPRGPLRFHDTAGWEAQFAAAGLAVVDRLPAGGANRLWRLRAAAKPLTDPA